MTKMMDENRNNQWLTQLRNGGYRITGARCIIIDILANTEIALEASEIYRIANHRYPSIGLVSVYRTLSILEDIGLIQRIHTHEKCQSYISAFTNHEHLILCNQCGRVEFFAGDDIEDLVKRVESECNYQVQGHWLQLFGTCKQCQQSQPQTDIRSPKFQ